MRLLVVEDEHRIAQGLKDGLEQESYAKVNGYLGLEPFYR
jgi:DNA-binding response OmpR family regulator